MEALICPVRECGLPLAREPHRVVCERGHSFDIARSGYINLLQPQDRRSKNPGDTMEAIAARRRLHDRNITAPLRDAILDFVEPQFDDAVLDAGCGEGFFLGSMQATRWFDGHGVDISVPAIDAAAKRYPACRWIVANADRHVPYGDGTFSLVLSITARRNAPEFHRVLRGDGRLLVAIPAPEDLIELRGRGRDRVASTIEAFASHFTLAAQDRVTTTAQLDEAAVSDVLHSIYRPLHAEPIEAKHVTFSLDLLLFRPARL